MLQRAMFISIISLTVFATGANAVLFAQKGQWVPIESSPVAVDRFDAMSFVSPDTGWIAGTSSAGMFRTYDGGKSWQRLEGAADEPGKRTDFRSLSFVSGGYGWVGSIGGATPLKYTSDGGTTWTPVSSIRDSGSAGVCGIQAFSATSMVCVGPFSVAILGAPHVTTTYDGVAYQTRLLSGRVDGLVDVLFESASTGVIGGNVGGGVNTGYAVILRTVDSGATWTEVYRSSRRGTQLWKFQQRSDGTIMGAIQAHSATVPYFVFSSDGGQSWEEGSITDNGAAIRGLQAVGFATPTLGWVGGRGFSSYRTTDGGATWSRDSSSVNAINRFQFFSDTLGYAAGQRIYRYVPDSVSTSVSSKTETIPDVVVTTEAGTVRIVVHPRFTVLGCSVYDVRGRVVSTSTQWLQNNTFVLHTAGYRGPLFVLVATTVDYLSAPVPMAP